MAADHSAVLLMGLDSLARQLIERAAPIRFDVARSPAEREAVFRLRFETVVAHGWAPPVAFPEGLERDHFDERAVHVAGWHDGAIAAAARLIFPEPGQHLPTEHDFDLRIEPAQGVVDIGRGIVVPTYRSRGHTVFAALLARCWLEIRARGLHHLCGTTTPSRVARYRHQLGMPFRVLGPARTIWGEERCPVFLDGVEFAASALARAAAGPG
jgi:N-acyl-L-homoserine lactone synthetase